jgi:hypothetical protein
MWRLGVKLRNKFYVFFTIVIVSAIVASLIEGLVGWESSHNPAHIFFGILALSFGFWMARKRCPHCGVPLYYGTSPWIFNLPKDECHKCGKQLDEKQEL